MNPSTNRPPSRRTAMHRVELAMHERPPTYSGLGLVGDDYERSSVFESFGWTVLASWGARGYDLGSWPLVMFYVRRSLKAGELDVWFLLYDVEGDITTYRFASRADLWAAIDYLFVWHLIQSRTPCPELEASRLTIEQLDVGTAPIPEALRGPYEGRFR